MKETHRQQGKGTGEDEDSKGVKYMAIKETDQSLGGDHTMPYIQMIYYRIGTYVINKCRPINLI